MSDVGREGDNIHNVGVSQIGRIFSPRDARRGNAAMYRSRGGGGGDEYMRTLDIFT